MINKLNYYFITLFVFGSAIKRHRGTWGFIIYNFIFILINLYFKNSVVIVSILLVAIFFYSFIAIKSCLNNFENEDPQEIVIDEFIGQSIPIVLYELFHSNRFNSSTEALQIYFWFFLLFRLFDGLKPFP